MLIFEQYPPGRKSLFKDKFANAAMTSVRSAASVRGLDQSNRHNI